MPTNSNIDPALVTQLQAAGKPTNLSMDAMVAQVGYQFVTTNLFIGNIGAGTFWSYKNSAVQFDTPESAVAYKWLNKPL